MTGRRRIAIVAAALAGLLVLLYAVRGSILPLFARWLDVGQPPVAADFVVPLPGDEPVRPFVAAALVHAGLAREAVILQTEAAGPPEVDRVPTTEVIRRVLLARGVPEDRIVTLDQGHTGHTFGDATLVAELLRSHPEARVTIVTSHYHTRRARWTFSLVLGDAADRVRFVSAPTDGYTADNWWQRRDGFLSIVGEYIKLAFYAVRYTSLPYWAAGAVIAAAVLAVYLRRRRESDTRSTKSEIRNKSKEPKDQ